jgi:hypothetical protein
VRGAAGAGSGRAGEGREDGVSERQPRDVSWIYGWQQVKESVIKERGNKCEVCGYSYFIDCDHIIPKALGGAHTADNAALLCPNCHRLKDKLWPQRYKRNTNIPASRAEMVAEMQRFLSLGGDMSKWLEPYERRLCKQRRVPYRRRTLPLPETTE